MSAERKPEFHRGEAVRFRDAEAVMPLERAGQLVDAALARWRARDEETARSWNETLLHEFPDQSSAQGFWHDAAQSTFRGFFTWGHDHDFGHGIRRQGAMGPRHVEICSESIARGLLPFDLAGKSVLDIGCWSGGDVLILGGLGAQVTALEEHPASAASARRLIQLSGCPAEVVQASLYQDRSDWAGRFDVIYCSGVVYHVTDPLLFLRICFAYLKPGGQLILETKADPGEDSSCGYSGTLVKGWNWYAPTRIALGRWLVDAGFLAEEVSLWMRTNGRLLAGATKGANRALPETAGFSRPGSWLEQVC